MKLNFLGAAGEVTGSCCLVEALGLRFLIDCGMFQGREAAKKNLRALPVDPASIDFVLLSHAHIDHSGLLPRLVAQGFRGKIHCTPASAELLAVMLPDSAHLQEKDSGNGRRTRGRRGSRKAAPEDAPLYSLAQALACLKHLRTHEYGQGFEPAEGVRCIFRDAGHILGSAILELQVGRTRLVFSGDLGQPGHPVVRDPEPVREADVLLVESTYGNREHKTLTQTLDEFAFALNDALTSRRGNVVIPSFAVGRTQDILYFILQLHRQGRIPDADVYVDSPMALAATRIMLNHPEIYDADASGLARWISTGQGGPRLHFSESLEDSMRINGIRSGAIIISASGMCEGGRIRHHLRYNIARAESTIIFCGFQAAGTLGRRIVDGARTIRMGGETFAVRARVFTIGGLSAHADRSALMGWLGQFRRAPERTFVVHGEPLSAGALCADIRERLGWRAEVPDPRKTVDIAPGRSPD